MPRAALVELEDCAKTVGDLTPHVTMIEMARLALRHLVAQEDGNLGVSEELGAETDAVRHRYDPASPLHDRSELLHMLLQANAAAQRGDMSGAATTLQDVLQAAERIPPGDPLRVQIDQMREMLEPLLALLQPAGPATPGTWSAASVRLDPARTALDQSALARSALGQLEQLAVRPGLSAADRAIALSSLATAEIGVGTVGSLNSAVDHLREALAASPEHDPRRAFFLMSLGLAYVGRFELAGAPDDLAAGTTALERARDLAGTSASVYCTMCANPLAHAYRLAGRRDLGRRVALDGLRGHAWTVLLQSGPQDAQDAARHAAEDAVDVARWCLSDDDPEGAAAALDAGRGLILYAATEIRDVDTRLRSSEPGLADEWRQALTGSGPTDVPSELRRRVVSALAGVPLAPDGSMTATPAEAAPRLLDPPGVHEVRLALRAMDADALVYLLPGDDGPGAAVVVPADEPPSWTPLPKLTAAELADVDRNLTAADQDVRQGGERSGRALDEVCDWAWSAATGPLLDHLTMPAERPVRLVLVPMRELSRVPWQAARRRVAGRTEYAVQRAVFSYAASARMLCESAWRDDVPLGGTGILVGDPDTAGKERDLPAARSEALAIRSAFYPGARCVGRLVDGAPAPDGAGTRADVLDWLADRGGGGGGGGGAMMHLACHAVLSSGGRAGDTSYLVLAGPEHLSAEDLIRALTAGPGRDVALAVLAACSSAESGRGYDEAFSLGTAFLASNVRSVISAQWSVPDGPTSALMFMVHHFLRTEGQRPVDALRQAQLWMILDRHPPETMPVELRQHLVGLTRVDLSTWAAFVHFGR